MGAAAGASVIGAAAGVGAAVVGVGAVVVGVGAAEGATVVGVGATATVVGVSETDVVGVTVATDVVGVTVATDVVGVTAVVGVSARVVGVVGSGVVVVVVVGTVDVVGGTVTQPGRETRFESSVVAPLRANKRPCTRAPVFAVIDESASIEPTKFEPTPSVAELPTFQKTLHACAPLRSATLLLVAVMSVEPAWNTNTAFGSFSASRASVPVIANDVGVL